jgi:hypothetical protein
MVNYTFLSKISALAVTILLLIGCKPYEDKIELQLEKQAIEEVFSIADYCNEDFDSIYILHPYSNTEKSSFKNLKMSNNLRNICLANISFDSFSTLLFINNGYVKAYSEIKNGSARFTTLYMPNDINLFPIEQHFILDKKRNVHIYNE